MSTPRRCLLPVAGLQSMSSRRLTERTMPTSRRPKAVYVITLWSFTSFYWVLYVLWLLTFSVLTNQARRCKVINLYAWHVKLLELFNLILFVDVYIGWKRLRYVVIEAGKGSSIYDVCTNIDYLDPPPPCSNVSKSDLSPPPPIVDVHIYVKIPPFCLNYFAYFHNYSKAKLNKSINHQVYWKGATYYAQDIYKCSRKQLIQTTKVFCLLGNRSYSISFTSLPKAT